MALSKEELLEIKKQLDTPGAIKDPAYRAWASEQVQAMGDEFMKGWGDAAPVPGQDLPASPSLGVKSVAYPDGTWRSPEGEVLPPAGPSPDDQVSELAGQLDPRFDLIPQALALYPATTHPEGDVAAEQAAKSGQAGDVTYAYEPPVSLVQKQLVDNPAFARMLRPDQPPSLEEIASMDASSPLYQDASNEFWRRTTEAAQKSGRTVYRYSKLPYLWGDEGKGVIDNLALKVGGAGAPVVEASKAFILGSDDTAALGLGRAATETAQPEMDVKVPGVDRMGVNEDAPQSTAQTNAWTVEEHPVAYGLGQLRGLLTPLGIADRIFQGVSKGTGVVAKAIGKTRLGGLAGKAATAVPGASVAGRAAGDAAIGGVAAGAEELGRQGVDIGAEAAQTGELPSQERLSAVGDRVLDTASSGAKFGAGGSLLAQGAHAGADYIRDSDRFQGKVRRTEPNLDWSPSTAITGPRLSGETKELVKRANREGVQAGDLIAEEIAPPIRGKAAENTSRAEGRARAERANHYQTAEGAEPAALTHLQERSLERLRDHYQPEAGGKLQPIDDKARPVHKVFNTLARDVSTSPIEGAVKLSPEEAEQFLGSRWRHKLLKDDIEAAGARAQSAPAADIQRDAYLRTIKDSRAREAADEEIEASIEDIVGDRTPTPAARAKAEQQVLRDRVEEEAFTEANGPLGDYLRQRGIDAVYVAPRAYDARRTDTLIDGLGDEDLAAAAKLDRQKRPLGGKKGGYAELIDRGEGAIGKAKTIEKRVAPGGDAFQPVASLGQSRSAEKKLLDDTKALADQAGVREQLDKLRGLQDTQEMSNRARFRGRTGQSRNLFNAQNQIDAGMLRAFPVLRALEGPLGPLGVGTGRGTDLLNVGGGRAGKAALMGQEAPSALSDDSARARYERARERRLKELAAVRDEEKEKRDKRRARRAAGR